MPPPPPPPFLPPPPPPPTPILDFHTHCFPGDQQLIPYYLQPVASGAAKTYCYTVTPKACSPGTSDFTDCCGMVGWVGR